MNKLKKIACYLFSINFILGSKIMIENEDYLPAAVFISIFIFGVFLKSKYFWMYFFSIFGLMSGGFVFILFGGLEPSSPGLIASGRYFDIGIFLFAFLVASTIYSFVAGLYEERGALIRKK